LKKIKRKSRRENLRVAALNSAAMSGSGIGVQQILPRANADWQGSHHAPERHNADDNHEHHNDPPPEEPPRTPPSPGQGLGRVVDRTV
jgi:hypothetical protein